MEELTTEYDIKPSTALEYLYKFYQEGKKLRAEGLLTLSLLPPDQRQRIFGVFDKLGTQRLRPVFDALNGDIGYEELKLMRLCYLNP
jgi:ATP-dependent DNA helicase RecQ